MRPTSVDYHPHLLTTVTVLVRRDFRLYLGESFADKWGFFVDRNMSTEIHSYLDWIEYPMGDHVLEGHKTKVECAVITQDGCYLFTGSRDGEIIKWDMRTNEMITRFEAHSEAVYTLAHTRGLLISAGSYEKIKVWSDEDCSLIRMMDGDSKSVLTVSLNKRGTTLVSGSMDSLCQMWSVESGECLTVMKGHTHFVRRVLFAGDMIISGSFDGSIRFWNPESGKELRKITDGIDSLIYDLSLNCDSSMLVCCYFGGFTVFKYPSMEVINTVVMQCNRCCSHPSNPCILAVIDNVAVSIKVYRTDTCEFTHDLKGHSEAINSVQFSPDGSRLVSVSIDKTVRVWDVSDLA